MAPRPSARRGRASVKDAHSAPRPWPFPKAGPRRASTNTGGSEMDVGIQMIFSTYGWPGMSDREAWQEEIRLARLADELGFDAIWAVEHHFFDYSFCPDNLQFLSYLAPLCSHADLG